MKDRQKTPGADDGAIICTCGSWPRRSSGPRNIAHSDDCALVIGDGAPRNYTVTTISTTVTRREYSVRASTEAEAAAAFRAGDHDGYVETVEAGDAQHTIEAIYDDGPCSD